jgi:histidinol-phosphatase (PHP family)
VIDLHLHTSRCGHAQGTVAEFVEAGRAADLDVMCFTDHMPMPAAYPQHYTMRHEELPDYMEDVAVAAAFSRETGGPEVLCGVEADWLPDDTDYLRAALSAHDFDLVLGSVHFIGGWAFDDPDLIAGYESTDIDALWARYFGLVADAARSGLFDVIAHPDLIKKFGFMPGVDPRGWYEETALSLAEGECAVEVNAGGLRKPVGEIYPALGLLEACRRRGVPATFGSDAHAPEEVASGVAPARELLLAAGYRSLVVFRGREPHEVAL